MMGFICLNISKFEQESYEKEIQELSESQTRLQEELSTVTENLHNVESNWRGIELENNSILVRVAK